MWMLKSLKQPPPAQRKLWKRRIWNSRSVMLDGLGVERKVPSRRRAMR